MTAISDSYITTDTIFETWLDGDPRAAAIALKAAAVATQTWYLQRATKIIDSLPLSGYKLLSTQARAFPRKYDPVDSLNPWGNTYSEDSWGYIYDSEDIPQDVKDACCEEALALYDYYSSKSSQNREALKSAGVTSYSLGDLSENLGGSTTITANCGLRSQRAYDLLEQYISRRGDIR